MLYGISGNTNKGATQSTSNDTSGASQIIGDRILALQQEIQALQKKQDLFDRVKIPRAKPFSKTPLLKGGPSVTFEKEPAVIPAPNRNRTSKTPITNPVPPTPIHPYASANPRYQPTGHQNSTNPMDRRNDQNTSRNEAPIADLHKSTDIFDKCLSTPVTLTVGELCGVSVKIRNHFRDSTSSKRLVNVNNTKIAAMAQSKIESKTEGHFGYDFETDYFHHSEQLPPSNPYEMYHQSLTNEPIADDVQVAKEADAICTIKANLNNFGEVDCIVDSGSQVVAISESMAVKFGLTWDPRITLKMVSANGQSDDETRPNTGA
ncbi:hypothetical protein C0991_005526 [Blastosporella zonata]|nr:hypothetical protein C0991_005526 [Blastosporella zonata]